MKQRLLLSAVFAAALLAGCQKEEAAPAPAVDSAPAATSAVSPAPGGAAVPGAPATNTSPGDAPQSPLTVRPDGPGVAAPGAAPGAAPAAGAGH